MQQLLICMQPDAHASGALATGMHASLVQGSMQSLRTAMQQHCTDDNSSIPCQLQLLALLATCVSAWHAPGCSLAESDLCMNACLAQGISCSLQHSSIRDRNGLYSSTGWSMVSGHTDGH
jgi:hypothetical protein